MKAAQAKARAMGGDGLVPRRWEHYVEGGSLRKRVEFAVVRYGE
ncbi:MAG TPA: hypothetical protein VFY93_06305 [Planctomycetota bacterium]|nr:hypothetical protein [Planctomycetota bacterium]